MIRYFKKVKHLYCSALDYHNRIVTAKREIDDVIDLSEELYDKYGKLLGQLKAQSERLASDTQDLVCEVHDDTQRARAEIGQAQRAVQRLLTI